MALLDNRGLTPPEPMVRILEALEHLAPGEQFQALNDREPHFLFPELVDRGFVWELEHTAEGVLITIRHGSAAKGGKK